MRPLNKLFENNQAWAESITAHDPEFFAKLARQQSPEFLWIGCSDSRVPANEIVGLLPGELFVHRNVGNIVSHTDLNCLSVIQYAVETLRVEHIIVCGHYGCGAIGAAIDTKDYGLLSNWLQHIKDVHRRHKSQVDLLRTDAEKIDRLCELNVVEQVANVCHTSIVQNAWKIGSPLSVHGWIYSIKDGLLQDLDVCVTGAEQVAPTHRLE
jgi:carbonic anhydrase